MNYLSGTRLSMKNTTLGFGIIYTLLKVTGDHFVLRTIWENTAPYKDNTVW